MIERILELVAETDKKAHVKTVFGEPQTIGARTVIPVAEVRYGYGVGQCGGQPSASEPSGEPREADGECGSGKMHGEGGAVRMSARPIAVIEITPEGMQIVPVYDSTRLTLAGMALGGLALSLFAWMIHRLAK